MSLVHVHTVPTGSSVTIHMPLRACEQRLTPQSWTGERGKRTRKKSTEACVMQLKLSWYAHTVTGEYLKEDTIDTNVLMGRPTQNASTLSVRRDRTER